MAAAARPGRQPVGGPHPLSQPGPPIERTLWNFGSALDGRNPRGALISDSSGALYGTTYTGGKYMTKYYGGTAFRLNPSGDEYSERILWSLGKGGSSSEHPTASLLADSSGRLFGTSDFDAFSLTPSGKRYSADDIFNFGNSYGTYLTAPLISSNGILYGTAYEGGTYDSGTVFALSRSKRKYTARVLWNFGYSTDGENPRGALLADASGDFYGTTEYGGAYFAYGTVFKLTPSGGGYREQVLWSFGPFAGPDGSVPYCALIADSHGALLGTTSFGGANGAGAVFKLTPAGSRYDESILWSFGNGLDGAEPTAGLLPGPNGSFYGTTTQGGAYHLGTVYQLKPIKDGYTERVLWSFGSAADGAWPFDSLIADRNGALYGTTYEGGAYGYGTVFQLTP